LPPDVRAFCAAHRLDRYLEASLERVRQNFQIVGSACVTLEQDGDSGEKWVSVQASVLGSTQDILAARKLYTVWWVEHTPWPERELIRLALDAA